MTTPFEHRLLQTRVASWQVKQIIAFDWYDGPREGICALAHPECCLYFQLAGEEWLDGNVGSRLFWLSELPGDAMERTLVAFGVEEAPNKPLWAHHGVYENSSVANRVEEALADILGAAVRTRLLARSEDMVVVQDIWIAVPELTYVTPPSR